MFLMSRRLMSAPQQGVQLPAWASSLSVGQIGTIPSGGTTITTAANGDGAAGYTGGAAAITAEWSGGAIVKVGGQPYLVVSGAGHGSTYNGFLKFGPLTGVGSDAPSWSIYLAASGTGNVAAGGIYSDGRQSAVHTYGNCCGVDDRYYMMGTDAYHSDGGSRNDAFYFTPAGQTNIAANSSRDPYGTTSYYEAVGKVFYVGGRSDFSGLRVYTVASNTWSVASGVDVVLDNYVGGAVDTTRGALFVCGPDEGVYWSNLANAPSYGPRLTGRNAPTSFAAAMLFDEDRDVFVSLVAGSQSVRELSASELAAGNDPAWTTRTFTGSTPAGGEAAGTFGRFRKIPGIPCYINVPHATSSAYVYRAA